MPIAMVSDTNLFSHTMPLQAGASCYPVANVKLTQPPPPGYALFIANTTNYPLNDPPIPKSWARIPATRHAMALFKHSTYFFQLDPDSLILQPSLTLNTHITDPSRITSLYLPNRPVVPPDSVIKTYPSRSASQIDLILTQDHEGLAQTSFILKRGAFADFFLDTWFDPLYRSYNFQRAEGHALEHLVQWHGTVLSRLALIPQRTMNSYYGGGNHDEKYRVGDFVARLQGCQNTEGACEMMGKRLVKEARDWEVGHSGKTEIKARGEEEAPIDARVLSTVVF